MTILTAPQCRPYSVSKHWVAALESEWTSQLMLERHLHLPATVKPSDDSLGEARGQVWFISTFTRPLFERVAQGIPGIKFHVSLRINITYMSLQRWRNSHYNAARTSLDGKCGQQSFLLLSMRTREPPPTALQNRRRRRLVPLLYHNSSSSRISFPPSHRPSPTPSAAQRTLIRCPPRLHHTLPRGTRTHTLPRARPAPATTSPASPARPRPGYSLRLQPPISSHASKSRRRLRCLHLTFASARRAPRPCAPQVLRRHTMRPQRSVRHTRRVCARRRAGTAARGIRAVRPVRGAVRRSRLRGPVRSRRIRLR